LLPNVNVHFAPDLSASSSHSHHQHHPWNGTGLPPGPSPFSQPPPPPIGFNGYGWMPPPGFPSRWTTNGRTAMLQWIWMDATAGFPLSLNGQRRWTGQWADCLCSLLSSSLDWTCNEQVALTVSSLSLSPSLIIITKSVFVYPELCISQMFDLSFSLLRSLIANTHTPEYNSNRIMILCEQCDNNSFINIIVI